MPLDELIAEVERDFISGYLDSHDNDAPCPGENRSAAYRHSFEVGRAELAGEPIPAAVSRLRAQEIIAALRARQEGENDV